jgi:hypothetical protein
MLMLKNCTGTKIVPEKKIAAIVSEEQTAQIEAIK